eukprot:284816588_4
MTNPNVMSDNRYYSRRATTRMLVTGPNAPATLHINTATQTIIKLSTEYVSSHDSQNMPLDSPVFITSFILERAKITRVTKQKKPGYTQHPVNDVLGFLLHDHIHHNEGKDRYQREHEVKRRRRSEFSRLAADDVMLRVPLCNEGESWKLQTEPIWRMYRRHGNGFSRHWDSLVGHEQCRVSESLATCKNVYDCRSESSLNESETMAPVLLHFAVGVGVVIPISHATRAAVIRVELITDWNFFLPENELEREGIIQVKSIEVNAISYSLIFIHIQEKIVIVAEKSEGGRFPICELVILRHALQHLRHVILKVIPLCVTVVSIFLGIRKRCRINTRFPILRGQSRELLGITAVIGYSHGKGEISLTQSRDLRRSIVRVVAKFHAVTSEGYAETSNAEPQKYLQNKLRLPSFADGKIFPEKHSQQRPRSVLFSFLLCCGGGLLRLCISAEDFKFWIFLRIPQVLLKIRLFAYSGGPNSCRIWFIRFHTFRLMTSKTLLRYLTDSSINRRARASASEDEGVRKRVHCGRSFLSGLNESGACRSRWNVIVLTRWLIGRQPIVFRMHKSDLSAKFYGGIGGRLLSKICNRQQKSQIAAENSVICEALQFAIRSNLSDVVGNILNALVRFNGHYSLWSVMQYNWTTVVPTKVLLNILLEVRRIRAKGMCPAVAERQKNSKQLRACNAVRMLSSSYGTTPLSLVPTGTGAASHWSCRQYVPKPVLWHRSRAAGAHSRRLRHPRRHRITWRNCTKYPPSPPGRLPWSLNLMVGHLPHEGVMRRENAVHVVDFWWAGVCFFVSELRSISSILSPLSLTSPDQVARTAACSCEVPDHSLLCLLRRCLVLLDLLPSRLGGSSAKKASSGNSDVRRLPAASAPAECPICSRSHTRANPQCGCSLLFGPLYRFIVMLQQEASAANSSSQSASESHHSLIHTAINLLTLCAWIRWTARELFLDQLHSFHEGGDKAAADDKKAGRRHLKRRQPFESFFDDKKNEPSKACIGNNISGFTFACMHNRFTVKNLVGAGFCCYASSTYKLVAIPRCFFKHLSVVCAVRCCICFIIYYCQILDLNRTPSAVVIHGWNVPVIFIFPTPPLRFLVTTVTSVWRGVLVEKMRIFGKYPKHFRLLLPPCCLTHVYEESAIQFAPTKVFVHLLHRRFRLRQKILPRPRQAHRACLLMYLRGSNPAGPIFCNVLQLTRLKTQLLMMSAPVLINQLLPRSGRICLFTRRACLDRMKDLPFLLTAPAQISQRCRRSINQEPCAAVEGRPFTRSFSFCSWKICRKPTTEERKAVVGSLISTARSAASGLDGTGRNNYRQRLSRKKLMTSSRLRLLRSPSSSWSLCLTWCCISWKSTAFQFPAPAELLIACFVVPSSCPKSCSGPSQVEVQGIVVLPGGVPNKRGEYFELSACEVRTLFVVSHAVQLDHCRPNKGFTEYIIRSTYLAGKGHVSCIGGRKAEKQTTTCLCCPHAVIELWHNPSEPCTYWNRGCVPLVLQTVLSTETGAMAPIESGGRSQPSLEAPAAAPHNLAELLNEISTVASRTTALVAELNGGSPAAGRDAAGECCACCLLVGGCLLILRLRASFYIVHLIASKLEVARPGRPHCRVQLRSARSFVAVSTPPVLGSAGPATLPTRWQQREGLVGQLRQKTARCISSGRMSDMFSIAYSSAVRLSLIWTSLSFHRHAPAGSVCGKFLQPVSKRVTSFTYPHCNQSANFVCLDSLDCKRVISRPIAQLPRRRRSRRGRQESRPAASQKETTFILLEKTIKSLYWQQYFRLVHLCLHAQVYSESCGRGVLLMLCHLTCRHTTLLFAPVSLSLRCSLLHLLHHLLLSD